MSQLPDPTANLKGSDLKLYHDLCAKRGRIDGMYRTLLNHPQLTEHVSNLGTYLRFDSTLPGNLREFTILYTANKLKVEYEWIKHLEPARKAGLDDNLIGAIQDHMTLPEPFATIARAADNILNLENIPQQLQNSIIEIVQTKGLLELVVLIGFYRMIAGVIRACDVQLPTNP
ncbi:MAG: hypothetical protein Q8K75_05630 [Chlamydiales bacterium]|nr:hypothetical protein [Chlamydiales bacterium]